MPNLQTERNKLIGISAKIILARQDFFYYCNLRAPGFYKPGRAYLREMCQVLQDFLNAPQKVLAVDLPPRHGKSRTLQLFVEWALGHNHALKVMTGSYNEMLATVFAKGVRDSIQAVHVDDDRPVYADVFPGTRIKAGDGSANRWSLEDGYNNYLATSPGGSATGFGCFPAGTMVMTENGDRDIADIFNDKNSTQVLSCDHKSGMVRYNSVQAKRRLVSNGIIEVTTSSGRKIKSTADHRYYTQERGYVEGRDLRAGETLTACSWALPKMRKGVVQQREALSRLLRQRKTGALRICLRPLRKKVLQAKIRSRKSEKTRSERALLQSGLCLQSESKRAENALLQDLRQACAKAEGSLLFEGMPNGGAESESAKKDMRLLRRGVHCALVKEQVLLLGLQELCPLKGNGGAGKFPLSEKQKLQRGISTNKAASIGARPLQVPALWSRRAEQGVLERTTENKSCCSPRRRQSREQCYGKPNKSLHEMPHSFASHFEKVKSVRFTSEELEVYDLQVANDHNFFANGVLVHNCDLLIIDDLIKNAEEASNELSKEKMWTWFTQTMLSRLEEGGKIVIVMTRWASNDLAGRALRHFGKEKVLHINMKAVQDDGSMLCDEILSKESCEEKKRAMGLAIWSANYQQEPIDIRGRLYGKFKTYDGKLPKFKSVRSYTDTADTGRDFLCSYVYGVTFQNEAYILDAVFTDEPMEVTEPAVARMLHLNAVNVAVVESNNGGRGFARNVERILRQEYGSNRTVVKWFTQTQNKQARILSNATWCMEHIYFPEGWNDRWPGLFADLFGYQRTGKNQHDDAEDALTGVCEDVIGGIVDWSEFL